MTKIRSLFKSNIVGIVILVVLVMTFLYSAYNSQQQLSQAQHINAIVKCQTRVNNQFNAVLTYNANLNEKSAKLDNQDRSNLNHMVASIASAIKKNNGEKISKAIFKFNKQRKQIDQERKILNEARANYPRPPQEQCK